MGKGKGGMQNQRKRKEKRDLRKMSSFFVKGLIKSVLSHDCKYRSIYFVQVLNVLLS